MGIAFAEDQPAVEITAPRDGQFIRGIVRIVVTPASGLAVDYVSVLAGGSLLGADFTAPYEVMWDTRAEADGPYLLMARARGSDFGELVSPRVTVTVDNSPPSVNWVAPKEGEIVAGTVPLQVSASDLLGVETVRFLANAQAIGEVVSPPYLYQWDTTALPNIRCALEARVFDRAGNSTSSPPLTVKVSNPNQYPVLEPVGSKTVLEGVLLAIPLKASDADGARDPLTYHAVNLPSWLHLNEQTGDLRGTPDFSEVRTAEARKDYAGIRLEVCDPEPLCDSEVITGTVVNQNRPPVFQSPGDQTLEEGQPFAITLSANDPDGDPLTCRAIRLPSWATFDRATCTTGGVPGPGTATLAHPKVVYTDVGFEVCDSEPLCVSHTITVIVLDVQNRPPVFDPIAPQTVDEDKALRVTIRAQDADGEVPALIAKPLPDGSMFEDNGNGTALFTWTPRRDQSGTYEMTLSATDGALVTTERFQVMVRERSLVISGTVIDGTTQLPVKGAIVEIRTGAGTVQEVTTDERGSYLTKSLSPGEYQLYPRYALERSFSFAKAQNLGAVTFSPSSQRVTLTNRDLTGVDFISSYK